MHFFYLRIINFTCEFIKKYLGANKSIFKFFLHY